MKIPFIDRLVILFTGKYHKAIRRGILCDIENLAHQCYPGAHFDCIDLRKILNSIVKEYEP